MKNKLVDKTARVTSSLDQIAADQEATGDAEGAKTTKELADSFSKLGEEFREIIERVERRTKILDEFAEEFRRDNNRWPSPEEQNEEMHRRGFKKDGEWNI